MFMWKIGEFFASKLGMSVVMSLLLIGALGYTYRTGYSHGANSVEVEVLRATNDELNRQVEEQRQLAADHEARVAKDAETIAGLEKRLEALGSYRSDNPCLNRGDLERLRQLWRS